MPPATLPGNDPCTGQAYQDGAALSPMVERLRTLTVEAIRDALSKLHAPRWGATAEATTALAPALHARATTLVREFDRRYMPLLEGH